MTVRPFMSLTREGFVIRDSDRVLELILLHQKHVINSRAQGVDLNGGSALHDRPIESEERV